MAKYSLSGKTVIVTGASDGIGGATVRELIGKGANVALVDLTQQSVDDFAVSLPPAQVLPIAADVTDVAQMTVVVDATVARFGKVDVVFANAGIAYPGTLESADLAAYERVIEVDLFGVIRTIKPALPQIIANKGYVLITASIYAFANGVVNSPYAASKAAVESLGRSLRLELASEGASAGVLYPGWIRTAITDVVRDESATQRLKDHVFKGPLGNFAEPEDVARAAVKGIESKAPRIIVPKFWAPTSMLRGAFNAASDAVLEKDKTLLGLIREVAAETHAKQS
ncbi:MAG TPA: SDR family NAD(P)-dependent oxidoreductase [Marmoricola sp.]|nr:SDR family NAD(P)-dependent oxidoreductase [Marmoricola sp.]